MPDAEPRLLRSFRYALRGLRRLVRTQANARIHLAATLGVLLLGMYAELALAQWALLVLAIGLVWTAEALNTAVETLADCVTEDYHPLIEKAKDVAAAGVLLAALTAAGVGLLVLVPALVKKLA